MLNGIQVIIRNCSIILSKHSVHVLKKKLLPITITAIVITKS